MRIKIGLIILSTSAITVYAALGAGAIPFPSALDAAAITVGQSTNMDHQLIIGNGDINALVLYENTGKVSVRLCRNDLGDWREGRTYEQPFVKISEIREKGAAGAWNPPKYTPNALGSPSPKAAAQLDITIGSESVTGGEKATLDIRRAVVRVPGTDRIKSFEIRALADRNVFLFDTEGDVKLVPLRPMDEANSNGVRTLSGKLPSNEDWQGMSYAVALAGKGSVKCVAVATSFDSKDPLAAAVKLATDTIAGKPEDLVKLHEKNWADFWSASGVEMADTFMSDAWYRNLYFLRCVSRPGAACVGLYAGVQGESSYWYGNHTMNYNGQQVFFGAFAANHLELVESYKDFVMDWIPKGRWLAKNVFEAEGTYVPHNLNNLNFDPAKSVYPGRSVHLHHPWGYSLFMTGWTMQNIWWVYEYAPDREYLEKTAYPAVREAALFYASFLECCEKRADGRAKFGPTVVSEHHGWRNDLSLNYDAAADIAYAQWTMCTAIRGATLLKKDAALVERLEKALRLIPEYPTHGAGETNVVVSCAGAVPHALNIPVTTMAVYPADLVTYFSHGGNKDLFARTISQAKYKHVNDIIIAGMVRARLSQSDAFKTAREEFECRTHPCGTMGLIRVAGAPHRWNRAGHYTENFAATAVISEFLIQSVGDIIRVFPAWPKEVAAKFVSLRAQGGFLVSAEQKDGRVTKLEIDPTVDGKLRLLSPWKGVKANGKELKADERGVVELDTKAGVKMVFEQKGE